jgi:hypothetical protein
MTIKEDIILRHDIVIKKGSKIKGEVESLDIDTVSGLKEVKIKKRYAIRGGLTVETGSVMAVGESRAAQLISKNIAELKTTKLEENGSISRSN